MCNISHIQKQIHKCVYTYVHTHTYSTYKHIHVPISQICTHTEVINKMHVHLKGIRFIIYSHEILRSIFICTDLWHVFQFIFLTTVKFTLCKCTELYIHHHNHDTEWTIPSAKTILKNLLVPSSYSQALLLSSWKRCFCFLLLLFWESTRAWGGRGRIPSRLHPQCGAHHGDQSQNQASEVQPTEQSRHPLMEEVLSKN